MHVTPLPSSTRRLGPLAVIGGASACSAASPTGKPPVRTRCGSTRDDTAFATPMRRQALLLATAVVACVALVSSAQANASSGPARQVRTVYREVLTAEYFGPASAVCSRLAASGRRAFTAGGARNCVAAFEAQQHILKHKTRGIDNSGYTPTQWRRIVNRVMTHLIVRVHGSRASAVGGQSGIPGKTTLIRRSRGWLFTSYPPSIQP
jgi:hypothetical protein